MKKLLEERYQTALGSENQSILEHLSLLRIALQHASIPVTEWVVEHGDADLVPAEVEHLRAPSDGHLVLLLERSTFAAEHSGWTGVSSGLHDKREFSDGVRKLLGTKRGTLHQLLRCLVESRNDGVAGHGIFGGEDAEAISHATHLLLTCLPQLFPGSVGDSRLELVSPDGRATRLKLLRLIDGNPVCYRKFTLAAGVSIRVRAQCQTSLQSREETVWETASPLPEHSDQLCIQYVERPVDNGWHPLLFLPERETEVFTGREQELRELLDWADDEGARSCLVVGDGGQGKTTLVLEFLHRLLEGELRSSWKPSVVTFYTAKKTYWTDEGLRTERFGPIGMRDFAFQTYSKLTGKRPAADWLKCSPNQLPAKLGDAIAQEWLFRPKEHLVVIDNAETLVESDEQVQELAKWFREIERKVGRLIVTSRRFERFGGLPIDVRPFGEDEAIAFLQQRTKLLGGNVRRIKAPIREKLRRLRGKPIVLEVLARTLSVSNWDWEVAINRVAAKQRDDLGDFLFEDAWARLSLEVRETIALMASLSDTHPEASVKICCDHTQVGFLEVQDALNESEGIANVQRLNGHDEVQFGDDFVRWCRRRAQTPQSDVQLVSQRYADFKAARTVKGGGRMEDALATPEARSAFLAYKRGDYEEAERRYELAIARDGHNAVLWDRYALFLLRHRNEPKKAISAAERATDLAPDDSEAWFTKGLVNLRIDPKAAGTCFETAERCGKPSHLCRLQMAYALRNRGHGFVADAEREALAARAASPSTRDKRTDKIRRQIEALLRMLRTV